jgi:hypothetical protein
MLSTYDAAADFSTTVNPNGVWTYGVRFNETADYAPFPVETALDYPSGAVGWNENSGSPPYVGINPTGSEIDSTEGIALPTGVLAMYPGGNGEYPDVRFTVPQTGSLSIAYDFTGIDEKGTTTDVHVLYNGNPIMDGAINGYGNAVASSGTPLVVADAVAGDTVDFIVGPGSNGTFDNDCTSLSAQVTTGGGTTAVDHLVFSKQPTKYDPASPVPLTVKILDAKDRPVTTATGGVTLSLDGTALATDVAGVAVYAPFRRGVATFSSADGPVIDLAGSYTLTATQTDASGSPVGSAAPGVSSPLAISTLHVGYTRQPATVDINAPVRFAVQVEDVKNKPMHDGDIVDVRLQIVAATGGAVDVDVQRALGDASKYDDSQPAAGDGGSLGVTAPGMYVIVATPVAAADDPTVYTATVSKPFKVLGDHLAFKRQPSTVQANVPIPFEVVLQDSKNRALTLPANTGDVLAFTLHAVTGSGQLNQGLPVGFASDYDNATAGQPLEVTAAGTYTMTIYVQRPDGSTDVDISAVNSKRFTVLA